jgi:hypothetical protein
MYNNYLSSNKWGKFSKFIRFVAKKNGFSSDLILILLIVRIITHLGKIENIEVFRVTFFINSLNISENVDFAG